jgi:hypothetical protein
MHSSIDQCDSVFIAVQNSLTIWVFLISFVTPVPGGLEAAEDEASVIQGSDNVLNAVEVLYETPIIPLSFSVP